MVSYCKMWFNSRESSREGTKTFSLRDLSSRVSGGGGGRLAPDGKSDLRRDENPG